MQFNMKFLISAMCVLMMALRVNAADQHHQHNLHRLQCWHCSSDSIGAEDFCGTVFLERNIPNELLKARNISIMRYCNSTIHSEHERAVCRKTIEETNDGKTVVKRHCYYTNKSDTLDHCMHNNSDKTVRRTFCQDCLTDKCNGVNKMTTTMLSIFVMALNIVKAMGAA